MVRPRPQHEIATFCWGLVVWGMMVGRWWLIGKDKKSVKICCIRPLCVPLSLASRKADGSDAVQVSTSSTGRSETTMLPQGYLAGSRIIISPIRQFYPSPNLSPLGRGITWTHICESVAVFLSRMHRLKQQHRLNNIHVYTKKSVNIRCIRNIRVP